MSRLMLKEMDTSGKAQGVMYPHATWFHKHTCAFILTEWKCGEYGLHVLVLIHLGMSTELKKLKQN